MQEWEAANGILDSAGVAALSLVTMTVGTAEKGATAALKDLSDTISQFK